MKLIEPSVNLINDPNPLKKIEIAGRTCYKSDSEYTNESSIKFYRAMSDRRHYAMLEHGNLTFKISGLKEGQLDSSLLSIPYLIYSYVDNNYLITISCSHISRLDDIICDSMSEVAKSILHDMRHLFYIYYILDSNERVGVNWIEGHGIKVTLITDINDIIDLGPDIFKQHAHLTFKFICDRGVSHELVRHRCSVAQESQRYCNYSKDKFGNEITFIIPYNFEKWPEEAQWAFKRSLEYSERKYLELIEHNMPPEKARGVLPNATKTEVILTMPIAQWVHFINLRSVGSTGKPHPDMKILADQVATKVNAIINLT